MQQNSDQTPKNNPLKADGTPKSAKQIIAECKAIEWQSLSPQMQLAELDRRLGAGVGAENQRARIYAALDGVHAKMGRPTEHTERKSPVNAKHTPDEKVTKQITHAQAAVAAKPVTPAPQKPMTRVEYKKALREGKVKPSFTAPGTPIATAA